MPERIRSPKNVRYWKLVAEALYLVRVSAAVAGQGSRSRGGESIMKVMIRFGG